MMKKRDNFDCLIDCRTLTDKSPRYPSVAHNTDISHPQRSTKREYLHNKTARERREKAGGGGETKKEGVTNGAN